MGMGMGMGVIGLYGGWMGWGEGGEGVRSCGRERERDAKAKLGLVVRVVQVALGRQEKLARASDPAVLPRTNEARAVRKRDLRLAFLLAVRPAALVDGTIRKLQDTLAVALVLNPVTLCVCVCVWLRV